MNSAMTSWMSLTQDSAAAAPCVTLGTIVSDRKESMADFW